MYEHMHYVSFTQALINPYKYITLTYITHTQTLKYTYIQSLSHAYYTYTHIYYILKALERGKGKLMVVKNPLPNPNRLEKKVEVSVLLNKNHSKAESCLCERKH